MSWQARKKTPPIGALELAHAFDAMTNIDTDQQPEPANDEAEQHADDTAQTEAEKAETTQQAD